MSERFFIPDESGMGGDWRSPGDVFYDSDARGWFRQVDQFVAISCEGPRAWADSPFGGVEIGYDKP